MAQIQLKMPPTNFSSPGMPHPQLRPPGSGMIVTVNQGSAGVPPTIGMGGPAAPALLEHVALPMGPAAAGHVAAAAASGPPQTMVLPPAAAMVTDHHVQTTTVAIASPNSLSNGSRDPHILSNDTSPSTSSVANTKEKTPMCLINELARYNKANFQIQHQYRLTDESGPAHKKTFFVTLRLGEEEYTSSGPSIKKAQHAAAALALEKANFKHPPPKAQRQQLRMCPGLYGYPFMDGPFYTGNITPTVELNALAMKRGEPALYKFLEPPRSPYIPPNFNFRGMYHQRYHYQRAPQMYYVSLTVGNLEFVGEGRTSQSARHNAAAKALKVLRDLPLPDHVVKEQPEESKASSNGSDENVDPNSELKSPISLVHEIALKRNYSVGFEVVRESGPPHMRTFITKCLVGDMVTEGEGNGKKISKKRAAEKMLEELKKLPALPPIIQRLKKKAPTVKKKSRNLIKVSDSTEQKSSPEYGQGINPISRLIQIQQAKKEKEPVYVLIAERGLPRRREFVMQVSVAPHSCTGTGPNKKLAKRAAAEGLLQILGYSRPQPQPSKPAIKTPGQEGGDADRSRKVTFLDPEGEKPCNETRSGRQLVPGLILMPDLALSDRSRLNSFSHGNNANQGGQLPNSDMSKLTMQNTATIAKELLTSGISPTAESLLKSGHKPPSCQVVHPKQQLLYLADVLGFNVHFTDFPKGNKNEFLSLVSLTTIPPQVSHGAGSTLEASHDQAALTALQALAELGIDNITETKVEPIDIAAGDGLHIDGGQKLANSNGTNLDSNKMASASVTAKAVP